MSNQKALPAAAASASSPASALKKFLVFKLEYSQLTGTAAPSSDWYCKILHCDLRVTVGMSISKLVGIKISAC